MQFYGLKKCVFCADIYVMNPENFTSEDEAALRNTLKRCSPETIENAVQLKKTGDKALLDSVVIGIIERFAEDDKKALLHTGDDSIDMVKDLELDSLTMVEIVLLVEDALGVSVNQEDMASLHTLADIKAYIKSRVA
ncbi:MAG: acyl carrier protein [Verrucomicrobiaceae bacterium]|nr:acyl carrier protein [Verrucomicrobiaceae bacterium]